jgi:hypothetical protein
LLNSITKQFRQTNAIWKKDWDDYCNLKERQLFNTNLFMLIFMLNEWF